MEFNQEELEEKLKGAEVYQGVRFNSDEGVAFASRNTIAFEKQDWDTFARNGLVIATYSREGAENLAELGKNSFKSSWVFGLKNNNQVEKRVSALVGKWNFGWRLYVGGDSRGNRGCGRAFEVCSKGKNK